MDTKNRFNSIVFIIPSLSIGGMERVMSVLLKEFSQKSIEIHLILYGKNRAVDYSVPENVIIHKPNFNYSDTNRFIFTLKTILFIRKEIKVIKPNSILSFGEYWNNLVLLSLIGLKFKVFISDRSQPNKNLGKIQNKLRNVLYPKAAGYIAQTSVAAKTTKKTFKTSGYIDCPSFWDERLNWLGGKFRPENWMIKSVINTEKNEVIV